MSDLFMDMHRQRWHIYQTPPTSTTPSSTQNFDEQTFTHHNNHMRSNTNGAACNDQFNHKEEEQAEEDDDDITANILSLKLRKPKHWKWELSTSKSCSNIALPRILLYDHKGELLVDAQGEEEHVYKQEDYENPKRDKSKKRPHQHYQQHQRSATTNLTHSIRKALEKEFNGLQIQEATPSPEPTSLGSHTYNSQQSRPSRKAIELNTTDLPDYALSRRSSSLKGVRFNVQDNENDDYNPHMVSQIPEFLPTPPSTTTTPTSSSSGPREKRKYRRSHSSGRSPAHSESILERFSYQKGRFSSPEFAEEHQVQHAPRYFLRTSKAGTLVVQEDSFSHHPLRRRRRHKNQSTESLQNSQKLSSNTSPTTQVSANNSPTPSEIRRKKLQPIRRYLSDGNILLNKQLSTSEEDVAAGQKQTMDNVNSRQIRKYSHARNQNKGKKYWESRRNKKTSTTSTTTQKPREKTTKKPLPVEDTTVKAQGTTTTAMPLLPNIPESVENTDLENYDEVDQNHLNNEVEMFNENEEEYDEENVKDNVGADEEEKVEGNDDENVEDENGEDDYVEEDVNDNNDENNNIFL